MYQKLTKMFFFSKILVSIYFQGGEIKLIWAKKRTKKKKKKKNSKSEYCGRMSSECIKENN